MLPKVKKIKNVYLDYAAATPVSHEVRKATAPFLNGIFGNPSSLHRQGRESKKALEQARKNIAKILNCKDKEIVFTAGGTESVNLAILGVAEQETGKKIKHFITSTIEHHSVLNSFKMLKGKGHKVTFVDVDKYGFVEIEKLKKSVTAETVLISIMYANNEIGSVQPIAEIGKWLRALNTERLSKGLPKIFFHTDACQSPQFLDLNVEKLGVDLLTINGSKIYAYKQTGFLFVKSGLNLKPLIYGGGQERNFRSGTENVLGAVGLAKALDMAQRNRQSENQRIRLLQQYFIKNCLKIPGILLNSTDFDLLKVSKYKLQSLPNIVNLSFEGVEGEALMLYLDSYGVSVSTSSACSTGSSEASHVLLAIGRTELQAKSSIRFSFGKETKKIDLDYVLKILPELVKTLREIK